MRRTETGRLKAGALSQVPASEPLASARKM
jgi:hypothetical protein